MARRTRRGSQSVELALTLPLWFGLAVGVVDVTWVLWQEASFAWALGEGCRAGALVDVGDDGAGIAAADARVEDALDAALGQLGFEPCASCAVTVATTGAAPARALVCDGTRQASGLTVRWFGSLDLAASRTARLQWQREVAP